MSAPIVYIFIPGVSAIVLLLLSMYRRVSLGIAILIALVLGFAAWLIPIDTGDNVGLLGIQFSSEFVWLGRELILQNTDRLLLMLIFISTAMWLVGALFLDQHRWMAGLGLGSSALLTAAIAVEPFLYAAVLLTLTGIVCLPLLVYPAKQLTHGAGRILLGQVMGMPFLLYAGWVLEQPLEIDGAGNLQRAAIVLGLGLMFYLAIFPLHNGLPMTLANSNPYSSSFVIYLLSLGALLVFEGALRRYPALMAVDGASTTVIVVALLLIVTGGIAASLQRDFGRITGYFVLIDNGFLLLASFLGATDGSVLIYSMFVPRCLAWVVLAFSLGILRQHNFRNDFESVRGVLQRVPYAGIGSLVGVFTLLGYPLLAAFPLRLSVLITLAEQIPGALIWIAIGFIGGTIGAMRMAVVISQPDHEPTVALNAQPSAWLRRIRALLIIAAVLMIVLLGIFPQSLSLGML